MQRHDLIAAGATADTLAGLPTAMQAQARPKNVLVVANEFASCAASCTARAQRRQSPRAAARGRQRHHLRPLQADHRKL